MVEISLSANCESSGFPGCVVGTFTATIGGFSLNRLEFLGGTASIRTPHFDLGTDSLGLAWTGSVETRYPLEGVSQTPPIVFLPEPSTAALLGLGLAALGARAMVPPHRGNTGALGLRRPVANPRLIES